VNEKSGEILGKGIKDTVIPKIYELHFTMF
jgi:hypothetical protein